jgi:hypothetical protein
MRPAIGTEENGFSSTIFDTLDAWAKGVTVLEIDWQIRNAGQLGDITAPRCTTWAHPCHYCTNDDGVIQLRKEILEDGPMPYPRGKTYLWTPTYSSMRGETVPFPDHKFLVAISKAKTGAAMGASMLRPLAWWWCAANFGSDWLMNLAHLFGLPFRWATHTDGASSATISKISTMLENMGSAAWACFPEGTTLELKDVGGAGTNSPQADLLDRADKNCDLIVLGQTLTSDTGGSGKGGGSYGLGQVHAGVKQERIEAATQFVARVLNEQLIPSILLLNYGDAEESPEYFPRPNEDDGNRAVRVTAQANAYAIARNAGLVTPCREDEENFRREAGLAPMSEEIEAKWEENPTGEPPKPAPGPGQPPADEPAPEGDTEPDDATEDAPAEDDAKTPAKGRTPAGRVFSRIQRQNAATVAPGARTRALQALAEDLSPLRLIAQRLDAITHIADDQIRAARLTAILEELPALKGDMLADPAFAGQLEQIAATALAHTLAATRKSEAVTAPALKRKGKASR